MLDNLRIVLVNTSHPGNIGSAARAMKTMGISQLVLVDPQEPVDGRATAMAAGAVDILANAKTVATLEDAIADCQLVIGTSARSRTLQWPMLAPVRRRPSCLPRGRGHRLLWCLAGSVPV